MVRPTNFLKKLKIDLEDAVAEYKSKVASDDKQAAAVIEYFTMLISQIPASLNLITSPEENPFNVIKKFWIYIDRIDTGYFSNPKKILIEKIEKILLMSTYSLENILKECIHHIVELNMVIAELYRVIGQLENKEIEKLEIAAQKDENEHWLFMIEQKHALTLKDQEKNQQKIAELQEKLCDKTSEIIQYQREIAEKMLCIEQLSEDKKTIQSQQKILVTKIKEIKKKLLAKPKRLVNLDTKTNGIKVHNESDTFVTLNKGFETLEKTLKDLQQQKEIFSKKVQSLTSDIEKETVEKQILKTNLNKVEKIKQELEQTKTQLQGESEQLKKNSQELRMKLDKTQENLLALEEKHNKILIQRDALETDYAETQAKLYEEMESKRILETQNAVLIGENADSRKSLLTAKENAKNLKTMLEEQEKNLTEKSKAQIDKLKKEAESAKKHLYEKEQAFKQRLQFSEEQSKNLENKLAIQEHEIKLLKKDIQVKMGIIEPLAEKDAALSQELMIVKPQLDVMTQHNEELHIKYAQLTAQFNGLKKENEDLKEQNENLSQRLTMLQQISPPASPQKNALGKFPFFNKKDTINPDSHNSNSPGLSGNLGAT